MARGRVGDRAGLAHLDRPAPLRVEHLLAGQSPRRDRVEDAVDNVHVRGAGERQLLDRAVALGGLAVGDVLEEVLVLLGHGGAPEVRPGAHHHVDDAAGPNVDRAGVERLVLELLGRDVGPRAAHAVDHVDALLPRHAEALAVAKVADLAHAVLGQQHVLGLEVAVRDAHGVHVRDAAQDLLEEAVGLLGDEPGAGAEDERVQVAAWAELHHLAEPAVGVLHEVERVDDVVVPQRGRDAELGHEPLAKRLLVLGAALFELLDRVQHLVAIGVEAMGHPHRAIRALANDLVALAVLLHQTHLVDLDLRRRLALVRGLALLRAVARPVHEPRLDLAVLELGHEPRHEAEVAAAGRADPDEIRDRRHRVVAHLLALAHHLPQHPPQLLLATSVLEPVHVTPALDQLEPLGLAPVPGGAGVLARDRGGVHGRHQRRDAAVAFERRQQRRRGPSARGRRGHDVGTLAWRRRLPSARRLTLSAHDARGVRVRPLAPENFGETRHSLSN